jgi:hypothetical protein
MNGSQDVGQRYTGAAPPLPDNAGQGYADPGAAGAPPAWQRNARGYGEDPRRKSPALAAILSAMPGLGQVYVGYYQQGFAHVLVAGTLIVLLSGHGLNALKPLMGFFLGFFWLYNIIDAYRRALFYNHALAGIASVDLPPEIKLPKGQGSLIGGVVLIGFGLLFLANTAFGVSLDWLDEWWPAALVLMGVYLVWASVAAKRKTETAPGGENRG